MTDRSQGRRVDLRGDAHPRLAAYAAVRERTGGEPLELLLGEEPSLLMQAVALMVRNRIHWEITDSGEQGWRVRVVDREQVPPSSLTDLLARDHERVDRLFALALQHANRGETAATAALVESCYQGLRRHIYLENHILAPRFGIPAGGPRRDPTNQMIDEHDTILAELGEIRELAGGGTTADASMLAALMGILSGALAKHEGREEQNLFPQWEAALKRTPDPDLLERAKAVLEGAEDDRVLY